MEIPASALFLSVFLMLFYWVLQMRGGKVPPGPIGLPCVGYIPFLTSEVHLDFQQLSKVYGSVFSVRLGPHLVVVLNDFQSLLKAEKIVETSLHINAGNVKNVKRNYSIGKEKRTETLLPSLSIQKDLLSKKEVSKIMKSLLRIEDYQNFQLMIDVKRFLKIFAFHHIRRKISSMTENSHSLKKTIKLLQTVVSILEFIQWNFHKPLQLLGITDSDKILGDFFIPKNTYLIANFWAINEDIKSWEEAVDYPPV